MKIFKILVIAMLIFTSCDNSESTENLNSENLIVPEITKAELLNATLQQKIDYKRSHMKVLAEWIAKNEKELTNLMSVNHEKSTKEDLETFKLEDLVNQKIAKSTNKPSEEDLKLQKSLDAFKDIEGDTWFPTIFIERIENKFSNKSNATIKTFLAIESEDVNGELVEAYEIINGDLDGDESLVPVKESFTPELIGDNILFVMELMYYEEEVSNLASYNANLKIDKMTIKALKERWPFRSKVAFKGYKISDSNSIAYDCNEYIFGSVNCWTVEGKRIGVVKRKWKDDERTYNWVIKTTNNESSDIIYYIIFEQDPWPAPIEYEYFTFPNGLVSRIPYKSWQGVFDAQKLSQKSNNIYNLPYANNFSTENSAIKYNFKLN